MMTPKVSTTETATLAGGCFWCLDAAYMQLRGVLGVVSGYAGGARPNPSYEQVMSGVTGHTETVQVTFDTTLISYADLLEVFWVIHNPTTKDRQGYDIGTEYRSIIFYASVEQYQQALVSIEAVQAFWPDPIVTEVVPLEAFYRAEEYHQHYFARNPQVAYCQAVINPKLTKLRQRFATLLLS